MLGLMLWSKVHTQNQPGIGDSFIISDLKVTQSSSICTESQRIQKVLSSWAGTVSSRLVNIHLSSSDFSVNETLISHEAVMVHQPCPCSADAHVNALCSWDHYSLSFNQMTSSHYLMLYWTHKSMPYSKLYKVKKNLCREKSRCACLWKLFSYYLRWKE